MAKSPEAFRTISEVAEWLGVPTHVLRFWESRFPQVKPVKRAGGRRYYRPSDMALLGGIRRLLHDDGMTIRGVQKLLREKGVKHVASLSPTGLEDVDRVVSEARLDGAWPGDGLPEAEDDTLEPEKSAGAGESSEITGAGELEPGTLVASSNPENGQSLSDDSESPPQADFGGAGLAEPTEPPDVPEASRAAEVVTFADRRKEPPATDLFARAPAQAIPLPPGVPETDPEDLPPAPHPHLIVRLGQLTGNARVAKEVARLAALRSRMAEGSAAAE